MIIRLFISKKNVFEEYVPQEISIATQKQNYEKVLLS